MLDLSERIREFVDGAEEPVSIFDIGAVLESRPTLLRRMRPLLISGGVVAAAAAVLFAAVLVPAVQKNPPVAAAAQLRTISANAAHQSAQTLATDQWLLTKQKMSIAAQVSQVGTTPTPDARATLGAAFNTWSNTNGQACLSAVTEPAQFAEPANQAAWAAAGLVDQPAVQPITGCSSAGSGNFQPDGLTEATGVIDVSGLPTDSATLAHELASGTTGIPNLDQLPAGENGNLAFERAAILLIGPDAGSTPAFDSALFGALALTPEIKALGVVTTHSGQVGRGFSALTSLGESAIVVDPSDGALLEARNIQDQSGFNVLSTHYLSSSMSGGIGSNGGSYSASILWLDPIGKPAVVGQSTHVARDDVAIFATAKPNVTIEQISALSRLLNHRYGGAVGSQESASSAQVANPNTPPPTTANGKTIDIGATTQWTFSSPGPAVQEWFSALHASGLFTSLLAF